MPNTRHSKCLEYHIKIANYLIHIVQQDKLNRPQVGKKKIPQMAYFFWGLHVFFFFYRRPLIQLRIDHFILKGVIGLFKIF